jgi:hypothetical protein
MCIDDWRWWGFAQHPYMWKTQAEWNQKMEEYSVQRADELRSAFGVAQAAL